MPSHHMARETQINKLTFTSASIEGFLNMPANSPFFGFFTSTSPEGASMERLASGTCSGATKKTQLQGIKKHYRQKLCPYTLAPSHFWLSYFDWLRRAPTWPNSRHYQLHRKLHQPIQPAVNHIPSGDSATRRV